MVCIEKIQRSLLKDLKTKLGNIGFTAFNRRAYDALYRLVVGHPTEATKLYKEFGKELCTQASPVLRYGDIELPLGLNADAVHAFRQALGFVSRLHALVPEDVKSEQLKQAAIRVARKPVMCVNGRPLFFMREFISAVIGECVPPIDTWPIHHGPGAVGDGPMRSKHVFRRVKKSIQRYIDHQAFYQEVHRTDPEGNDLWRLWTPDFVRLFSLPHQPRPDLELPEAVATKVVTVPKDATKVRIISEEPASSQFLQEGLKDILYKRMSRYGQINPNDQTRNQMLALAASRHDYQGDTLDMSDASDNVRWEHVKAVFPFDWIQAFHALRSPLMHFPDGNDVEITTFAPMGSALCFPVEMLVFASVLYAGYRLAGLCSSVAGFFELQDWGVFGDDIVAAHASVKYVLALLKGLDIPVNVSKSCIGDVLFKEACGLDAFAGCDVSIVRPRELSSSRVAAAPMVLHANRLFASGFVATAQVLADLVRVPVSLGYGPHLAEPGLKWPVLGKVRYNRALQRLEGQAPANRMPDPKPMQGWEALYLWFTDQRQSSSPFFRTERVVPVSIWVPMSPSFALDQCARSSQQGDVRISPGPKAYARGTPSGETVVRSKSAVGLNPSDTDWQILRHFIDAYPHV